MTNLHPMQSIMMNRIEQLWSQSCDGGGGYCVSTTDVKHVPHICSVRLMSILVMTRVGIFLVTCHSCLEFDDQYKTKY